VISAHHHKPQQQAEWILWMGRTGYEYSYTNAHAHTYGVTPTQNTICGNTLNKWWLCTISSVQSKWWASKMNIQCQLWASWFISMNTPPLSYRLQSVRENKWIPIYINYNCRKLFQILNKVLHQKNAV